MKPSTPTRRKTTDTASAAVRTGVRVDVTSPLAREVAMKLSFLMGPLGFPRRGGANVPRTRQGGPNHPLTATRWPGLGQPVPGTCGGEALRMADKVRQEMTVNPITAFLMIQAEPHT